jgi:hypothetical protein
VSSLIGETDTSPKRPQGSSRRLGEGKGVAVGVLQGPGERLAVIAAALLNGVTDELAEGETESSSLR